MIASWLVAACLFLNHPLINRSLFVPQETETARKLMADADARIERYRKADATILVRNARGKSVPNAIVKVEQMRHAFLFGCAALSLRDHGNDIQEKTYQKQFGDLFNFATLLTYWQDTDPAPDRQNLGKIEARARRLQEMGITVKGHPLILAGAFPPWAPADPDAVRDLNRKRIQALVSHFKGRIDVWDVVGDVTTASGAQNGLGAWARKAGPAALTTDALTWARSANPGAILLYNDYKLDTDYANLIRDVGKAGAPLDALGLEAHMIGSEWPLEKVWDTADTFAALGKPLHFSEITVLSDDPRADHSKTWPSTPEGEQRQAEYVEKLYTLLFSHPSVQAIAWWNFVDGDWDRIPGGLLRNDLTPKPAYSRLLALIKTKWWTSLNVTTDRTGTAKFRGFAGHYRLTVQTAKGGAKQITVLEADVQRAKANTFTLRTK